MCIQGKQSELEKLQQQLQEAEGRRANITAQLQKADIDAAEKLQVRLAPSPRHILLNLPSDLCVHYRSNSHQSATYLR